MDIFLYNRTKRTGEVITITQILSADEPLVIDNVTYRVDNITLRPNHPHNVVEVTEITTQY